MFQANEDLEDALYLTQIKKRKKKKLVDILSGYTLLIRHSVAAFI